MESMLIQNYQKSWVQDFQSIERILKEGLTDCQVSIEHVGSTAVPGLAAKPIIDIDLVYEQPEDFNRIRNVLNQFGYYHNGDQGIAGREVFKRNKEKTTVHSVLDSIAHHLYVCLSGNEELKRHLLFRDHLRENEEARLQYQQLKYKLAATAMQDRKQYAQRKEQGARSFINDILKQYGADKK